MLFNINAKLAVRLIFTKHVSGLRKASNTKITNRLPDEFTSATLKYIIKQNYDKLKEYLGEKVLVSMPYKPNRVTVQYFLMAVEMGKDGVEHFVIVTSLTTDKGFNFKQLEVSNRLVLDTSFVEYKAKQQIEQDKTSPNTKPLYVRQPIKIIKKGNSEKQ